MAGTLSFVLDGVSFVVGRVSFVAGRVSFVADRASCVVGRQTSSEVLTDVVGSATWWPGQAAAPSLPELN